jgi:nucleotide-binding universal stress UspA family protein
LPAPIIVAYDPFGEDRAPIHLALAAAELTGADVTAVSVLPSPYLGGWADPYVADTGLEDAIDAALLRVREEFAVETRMLTDASVPRALHTLARDVEAGMIVVGSTGRGRTGRVLPGSTAERLLHGSPCPVVLAPQGYVPAPLATIAVGFVDSPEGRAALAVAHTLAGRAGARLRVIAALHLSGGLNISAPESTPAPRGGALEGRHRTSVNAKLSAALDALPAGVDVETEIHVDDPADVLLGVSAHVDLLVCGSRGYGPLRSVLLGGVSRRLVDGAQCPVLVLPREAGRPLENLLRARPRVVAES